MTTNQKNKKHPQKTKNRKKKKIDYFPLRLACIWQSEARGLEVGIDNNNNYKSNIYWIFTMCQDSTKTFMYISSLKHHKNLMIFVLYFLVYK